MPIFVIKAMGAKQVATKFERMGIAAISAKPAMESVADLMMQIFEQIFQSQGRRGGGSWKRDSAAWLLRKQRNALDPRIGHATLALRRSLTVREDPNQRLVVTDTTVDLGSMLPYAAAENRNRPFVKFTAGDRLEMRQIVRDYLIGAFKA